MKKQEFLQKVFNLYHKYGIKSVTMDDISHELGISKKTLYEWVKDKHELVKQVIIYSQSQREKTKTLLNNSNTSALDKVFNVYTYIASILKEFNPSVAYDLKKYYPDLYYQYQKSQRTKMINGMKQNLIQGIREGVYRKDLNVELISQLHLVNIESIRDNDIFEGNISPIELFREMFRFFLRAIANPEKLNLIDKKIEELEQQLNQ